MELLHRLAKARGVPILIVSHRLEHVKSYSDRIVGLAGGRVALNVDSDLADPASLRSFFEDAVS
jgi:phosphonate transport system ATP-binding protein